METMKKSMETSETAEHQDNKCIIVGAPKISALHTLPFPLKKPAPPNQLIRCYIKRDKAKSTYHLFFGLDTEKGTFLLSARRINHFTCTEFIISSDAEDISHNGINYMGKVRSNFWETKFTIYDNQPRCTETVTSRGGSSSRRVSPNVPNGSYNTAPAVYQVFILHKHIRPHRVCFTMGSNPASAHESNDTIPSYSDLRRSLEDAFSAVKLPSLILKQRSPKWDEKLQCWFLDSRERETLPSVKTRQMIALPEEPADNCNLGSSKAAVSVKPGEIILQFGKIGENLFSMDYRYPLSAFMAFGSCLCRFCP